MSRRNSLILTMVFLIIGGYFIYRPHLTSSSQTLSSSSPMEHNMKMASLKPRFDKLIRTSKLKSPVHIELHNITFANEVEPGQAFRMQARITSDQPMDNLKFEWILPQGIEVQSGSSTTGELSLKNVRDHVTLEIELTQLPQPGQEESIWRLAKESFNKQIHLKVFREAGENKFVTTAQYNTMTQSEINSHREELAQRNSDYISQSKSEQQ